MTRRLYLALLALLIVGRPIAAQAPAGLMTRIEPSKNAADPDDTPNVKIATVGSGYQVNTGPAVTLWRPEQTATGNYTLKARFTLVAPSSNRNFYGLIFGGRNLSSENQRYLAFMVAQTGEFVILDRIDNTNTNQIQTYTANTAIKRPDASGKSVNDLEIRVSASQVVFVVNGTIVHTAPKTAALDETNGIWGVRISHLLPGVLVENLGASPMN